MKTSMYRDLNLALDHIRISRNKTRLTKILKCVAKYDFSGGITVSGLAKELVPIDPSTITRNCDKLKKLGLITKINKQAPYHITPELYTTNFLSGMMNWGKLNIWKSNTPIARITKDKTHRKALKLVQNKFWDFNKISKLQWYDPQIHLLSFANEIGATIIYLFLEALKPDNKINVSSRERDQLIIEWLRHVIDPWIILSKFCEIPAVNQGQAVWSGPYFKKQHKDGKSTFRKLSPNVSRYELDAINSKRLLSIYKKVFPLVFYKISKYAEELRLEYKEALTRERT